MRWGLLADIHANVEALQLVLARLEEERVDRIIVLGDMLGFGPRPEETIKLIRSVADMYILGDYDAAVLGKFDVSRYPRKAIQTIEWTRRALSKSSLEWLVKRAKASHWKRCMFVHGTPLDPLAGLYSLETVEQIHRHFVFGQVFSAHAHVSGMVSRDGTICPQTHVQLGHRDIVSVGSVGWVQEKNDLAQAHFVVWDSYIGIAEFKYVSYNPAAIVAEMNELGVPSFTKHDWPKPDADLV